MELDHQEDNILPVASSRLRDKIKGEGKIKLTAISHKQSSSHTHKELFMDEK
jgi:hypothetical protein